jgi:hypothetical protein
MALIGNITIGMRVATDTLAKGLGTAQTMLKGFESAVQSSMGALTGLAGMLGAGAVAAGGIFGMFIKSNMKVIDDLYDLAARLGMTIDEFNTLRYVADITGSEMEVLDKSLVKFTANLGDAIAKGGPANDVLKQLGLSATALSKMTGLGQMKAIIANWGKLPNVATEAAAAMDLFGKSGVYMLNTLRAGTAEVERLESRFKALGLELGNVDNIGAARDAIADIGRVLTAVGSKISIALAPYIIAIGEQFIQWATHGMKASETISQGIDFVITAIGFLGDSVQDLKLIFLGLQAGVTYALADIVKAIALVEHAWLNMTNLIPGMETNAKGTIETIGDDLDALAQKQMKGFYDEWNKPPASEGVKSFFDGIKDTANRTAAAMQNVGKQTNMVGEDFIETAKKVRELEEGLQAQVATFGKSSHQADIYKLSLAGASEAQLANARAIAGQLDKLEADKKATDELKSSSKSLIESLQTPTEKYTTEVAKLQKMLAAGLLTPEQFKRGEEKLKKEASEAMEVKHAGAIELGSKESYSAILKAQTTKRDEPQKEVAKNTQKLVEIQSPIPGLLRELIKAYGGSAPETVKLPA